jgi:predicted AAA+ superfamily ATPase
MENIITRLKGDFAKHIKFGKITALYGARRVGKTYLVRHYLKTLKNKRILSVSGDDINVRNIMSSENTKEILNFTEGYDIVFIDEAQRIPKIGFGLKILIDNIQNLQVIVSGSASFELAGQLSEPLTGRQNSVLLYPISIEERLSIEKKKKIRENLEEMLLFGQYPEVILQKNVVDKKQILMELTRSYLYKDILELDRVKNSKVLVDMLKLVAYQIGNELNLSELASNLGITVKTVQRYLDMFEKSFVLYSIRGFSRNARNEIIKNSKYYFYDVGVRNAVIDDFNSIRSRGDLGHLWENFVISERIKFRDYHGMGNLAYFWRTYEQQEIDLIEDFNGKLHAFEIKWNEKAKVKVPKKFLSLYPNAEFNLINRENFMEFTLK